MQNLEKIFLKKIEKFVRKILENNKKKLQKIFKKIKFKKFEQKNCAKKC